MTHSIPSSKGLSATHLATDLPPKRRGFGYLIHAVVILPVQKFTKMCSIIIKSVGSVFNVAFQKIWTLKSRIFSGNSQKNPLKHIQIDALNERVKVQLQLNNPLPFQTNQDPLNENPESKNSTDFKSPDQLPRPQEIGTPKEILDINHSSLIRVRNIDEENILVTNPASNSGTHFNTTPKNQTAALIEDLTTSVKRRRKAFIGSPGENPSTESNDTQNKIIVEKWIEDQMRIKSKLNSINISNPKWVNPKRGNPKWVNPKRGNPKRVNPKWLNSKLQIELKQKKLDLKETLYIPKNDFNPFSPSPLYSLDVSHLSRQAKPGSTPPLPWSG